MIERSPSPRAQFQKVRLLLLFGLFSLGGIAVLLSTVGAVPTVPDQPWIGNVCATVSLVAAATAWFWARPRIPLRRATMSMEEYWREPGTTNAANLALFLLEGSATLAISGTLLSGFGAAAAVAAMPILGMVALTPESIEQRV